MSTAPIGIFDSGIGGVTVWREIVRALAHESTVYIADQAHLPYGPRPPDEVRGYAEAMTRHLLERGCKAIVVACNTASAAALKYLREQHTEMIFVGMEPAVKPAALHTKSRVVGVMATPGTLQGRMFALAVERFASGVTLVNQPCPGLVEAIESGAADAPETESLLRGFLKPILGAGADTLVLACTHYPFALPLIRKIAGDALHVLDPAPAVARHLAQRLRQAELAAPASAVPAHEFITTADAPAFSRTLKRIAGVETQVRSLRWDGGALRSALAA